jgi:phage terminase small subunit
MSTGLPVVTVLNPKQLAFLEAYLVKPNATQAAIKAGYSRKSARQTGARLCAHPAIKEALRSRRKSALAKLEVTEERALQELASIAFSNLDDFLEWDSEGDLVVRDKAEIPRELLAALESIEEQVMDTKNKDGSRLYTRTKRKVKLYPKLPALQTICEYLGMTDSMAPKLKVYLETGIKRSQEPEPIDVTPEG